MSRNDKAQTLRGHKRRQKVLNRRLNRNPSDLKKNEGSYAAWWDETFRKQVDLMAEQIKEEKNEE